MNLDEVYSAMPEGTLTTDQLAATVDFLLEASDIPPAERGSFIAGYVCGLSLAMSTFHQDRDSSRDLIIARLGEFMMRHQVEWARKKWL